MSAVRGGPQQRPSWREEMRQDRLVNAQVDREREAARVQARIAERQAVAQMRRDEEVARTAARRQAREQRAARRADRVAWVRGHVLDLLFVPVIVVPAVLAWTAMAAYGYQLYGPPGLVLPAFSEGAMWAFAIATTWTLRRHPGRPTWHLRAGTWTFAAVAAALNFTHGLTGPGTHGAGVGVVMALVSVAGVVAHQFITAGPRRSRAERGQARIDRAVARRELAVRRAAVRHAVAGLDEAGHARLIYEPGMVTLTRRRGRTRLLTPATSRDTGREPDVVTAAAPGVSPAEAGDMEAIPGTGPAVTPGAISGSPAPALEAAPEATPGTPLHSVPGVTRKHPPATPGKQPGPATPERLREHYAAGLAAGQVPSIRQIKREWPVGYDRAAELHDHLTAVIEAAS